MRTLIIIVCALFAACNTRTQNGSATDSTEKNTITADSTHTNKPKDSPALKIYGNKRFREVTAERIGQDSFRLRGEGQIFEANFNWIVEDGHDELQKGYQMTDAGAPEWGKFDFTIGVKKKRENSTLTLVIFESSAMDGSRQHELSIPLY